MSNIVELIIRGNDTSAKAITSAVKNLEGMGSAFSAIRSSLSGLVSAGALISLAHTALELGDSLSKASKKFGMAVEDLSALRYAAELADVPFDSLEVGLGKLSQAMVSGAEKGSDMSYAFKALGVDIKSYGGNIGAALVDISRKIIEVDNAAALVDFSKSIFGRSGANMIPVMEDIAKGFGHMRTEAEKFNALMTEKQAKEMERHNDTLKATKMSLVAATANTIILGQEAYNWLFRANDISVRLVENLNKIAGKVFGGDTSGAVRFKAPPLPPATKTKTIEQIKAEEKAMEERKKLEEDYQKLHARNVAEEGKLVHDALAAEMGWSQEYFDTVSKMRMEDFAEWKKIEDARISYAEELRGTMDALGVADPEMDLAEGMASIGNIVKEVSPLVRRMMNESAQKAYALSNLYATVFRGMDGTTADFANMAVDKFHGMTDALTDFVMTGKANFRDFANSVIADIMRIAIRQSIVAPIAQGLMGAFSSASAYGGGFASGGSVSPGVSYLVGERGPELFVPSPSGSIVPGGGGGAQNIKVQVINESGVPLKVRNTRASFDAQEMVVTLWMDAAQRNRFGLRNMLGGA